MKITSKKINFYFLLIFAGLLFSCSTDDSDCTETVWYQDIDGDGLGNPDVSVSSCDQPAGYVANSDDPSDCLETLWYEDADGDGLGNPDVSISSCDQPAGYVDNDDDIIDFITNFFALTINNNWIYDVTTDDGVNPATTSVDDITVDETTIIDTNEYFGMSSTAGSTGIMTQLFDQNFFRLQSGVFYVDGEFTLPLASFGGTDVAIDLDNTTLFDESKTDGTELSTQSGVTSQNIGGFDLDIEYTFRTVQREILDSHTVGTETFNTVIKSDIILSLKVTTNVAFLGDITLLDTQDVLTINNFYANNVGLIDSDSVFTYTLEDLSALPVTIPIPETATVTTAQEITSYTVAD